MSSVRDDDLPPNLAKGLEAIRRLHVPDAHVAAIQNNFAYIDIGVIALDDVFIEEEVRLYARVSTNFPDAEPYGIVTSKFLHRADGTPVERQHQNHAHAQPVKQAGGWSDPGFWSWKWSNMPTSKPADLAACVEWARKRIREET